jgi:hypothetical protein
MQQEPLAINEPRARRQLTDRQTGLPGVSTGPLYRTNGRLEDPIPGSYTSADVVPEGFFPSPFDHSEDIHAFGTSTPTRVAICWIRFRCSRALDRRCHRVLRLACRLRTRPWRKLRKTSLLSVVGKAPPRLTIADDRKQSRPETRVSR